MSPILLDLEIFESKFEKTDGCWIWQGSLRNDGYGRFYIKPKYYGAHRIAYEIYKGEIPPTFVVRHRCDNPLCVNPQHLELGTRKDNVDDMYIRGRAPDKSGINNPNYKHGNYIGKFPNRVYNG